MLFNSYIFILLFLPLTLLGYFVINKKGYSRMALGYLILMSLWFYGYFNYSYLIIIILSVVVNFLLGKALHLDNRIGFRKAYLGLGILLNVGCLFYFKYFDFFIDNINYIFKTDFCMQNIMLPLGISFFTFQQISYIVDCYKDQKMNYGFVEYGAFVTFFPQLIAGPIVLHDELIPQLLDENRKAFSYINFAKGMYRFSLGLAKKVLLADTLSLFVAVGYTDVDSLTRIDALMTVLFYTLQIYFDFSGYCDMAIGVGEMFNLSLPENFTSPYKAGNIKEFWDRWHKTLTRFFTRYVYIPMGGSRKGTLRTMINTFVVFLVSGIWHGANWTFILWGCIHGIWMVLNKTLGKTLSKISVFVSKIWTFVLINLTWVYFRADSIGDANKVIKSLFVNSSNVISNDMQAVTEDIVEARLLLRLMPDSMKNIIVAIFAVVLVCVCLFAKNSEELTRKFVANKRNSFITAFLLIWCILSFSGVTEFLYFNF